MENLSFIINYKKNLKLFILIILEDISNEFNYLKSFIFKK